MDGLAMFWGYHGSVEDATGFAEEYRLDLVVLADADRSLSADYFITEEDDDAFAIYPRHFVIDRDGLFQYVSTTTHPDDLLAALETALAE